MLQMINNVSVVAMTAFLTTAWFGRRRRPAVALVLPRRLWNIGSERLFEYTASVAIRQGVRHTGGARSIEIGKMPG